MKKTFLLLVALVATVVGASAQGQTATLQQGDKMTPFYGRDAFKQAYNAAPQKGGVITLSAGTFNQVDSVMKEVKIIGSGYKENKTIIDSILHIKANNVTIEGVDVHFLTMNGTDHLTIRHSKILNLQRRETYNHYKHKNTIVDQCVVYVDVATVGGENYCIKNSFINEFRGGIGEKIAYVANCVFGRPNKDYIFAIFKNNLIGVGDLTAENEIIIQDIGEYYNNVFFSGLIRQNNVYDHTYDGTWRVDITLNPDTRSKTPKLNHEETMTWKNNTAVSYDDVFGESDEENPLYAPIVTTIKGDDGTVVGPYGGTGFSINPSIPRIVESKIDSNTDADGKLNVKIKVEVNN